MATRGSASRRATAQKPLWLGAAGVQVTRDLWANVQATVTVMTLVHLGTYVFMTSFQRDVLETIRPLMTTVTTLTRGPPRTQNAAAEKDRLGSGRYPRTSVPFKCAQSRGDSRIWRHPHFVFATDVWCMFSGIYL